jgi:type IV pilus biogenesis protein CpaD/CtpE
MVKIVLLLLAAALATGCAAPRNLSRPPMSVQAMPADCANRAAIINWLTQQASISKHPLESQESYENAQRQIRYRIWNIRYRCQPA